MASLASPTVAPGRSGIDSPQYGFNMLFASLTDSSHFEDLEVHLPLSLAAKRRAVPEWDSLLSAADSLLVLVAAAFHLVRVGKGSLHTGSPVRIQHVEGRFHALEHLQIQGRK